MISLPSKKVASVAVIAIAAVAAAIIAFGRDKTGSAITYTNSLIAGESVSIPENPNWESELGMIKTGNLPPQEEEDGASETFTDTVSKTLMSNYLAMKQSGSLDSKAAQKLVDQTADYISNHGGMSAETPKLNIIPNNGKQTIIDYGEKLGTIARMKNTAEMQKEIQTVMQFVQTEDGSKAAELEAMAVNYDKIAGELLKMPVPQTFVKAHTDIYKGAKGIALALKEIKNISTDPLKGLAALQLYQSSFALLSQATQATMAFITKNNVVYKQGSGGYYLLYGL